MPNIYRTASGERGYVIWPASWCMSRSPGLMISFDRPLIEAAKQRRRRWQLLEAMCSGEGIELMVQEQGAAGGREVSCGG
jgi:hypothetical protein